MIYTECDLYQEVLIFNDDGVKIGEAEIDKRENMLSRFEIYEPFQNMGYGTKAVMELTEKYNLDCLWVREDNKKAIHVYEKCGYKITKPAMYLMERKNEDNITDKIG